jgi:hypothetical protein
MKKVTMATMVVAISVIGGWNISQNKSDIVLSDMALANVEALADESGGSCSNSCNSWLWGPGGGINCNCSIYTGVCYHYCN